MRLLNISTLPILEPDPANTHLLQIGKDVRELFEELTGSNPEGMECLAGIQVQGEEGDVYGWEIATPEARSYVVVDSITDQAELRYATNLLASHCRNADVAFVVVGG